MGQPAVVEPDLSICGGFTEGMRIAVLPEMRGAGPAPYPWLEYDRSPNPLRELFGVPSLREDGTVEIPDGPGLGVTMTADLPAPVLVDGWALTA